MGLPGAPLEASGSLHELPRGSQEFPGGAQWPPRDPKNLDEAPGVSQGGPQEPPKSTLGFVNNCFRTPL